MKKITNNELRVRDVGLKVSMQGFVANLRITSKVTFIDLRDWTGITQLIINSEAGINLPTRESVISVEGEVVKRRTANPNLATGEIEVVVSQLTILSSAEETPFPIRDDINALEDTRLTWRYLDLRRPMMLANLRLRHLVIKAIRDYLDTTGFLEIETPILSKLTAEGARGFIVPTREANRFFALPQSPQLYKQLLMAGGIEKYFQIARCFRDEDARKDRQPEFTQLDIEISYPSEDVIKRLIEGMWQFIFKRLGKPLKTPFSTMNYDDAVRFYGSDKPDLRYELKLTDYSHLISSGKSNGTTMVGLTLPNEEIDERIYKALTEIANKNGAPALDYVIISPNGIKKASSAIINDHAKALKLPSGTTFFVRAKYAAATQALGAVRVELAAIYHLVKDEDELNFVWIENWPLLAEEEGKLTAMHHPFTASQTLFSSAKTHDDLLSLRARAYDLVLNGFEIGGGSIRISDFATQLSMFKVLGMEASDLKHFEFFLQAFKHGLPPHGGIAFGIDRIIMILSKAKTIRDVIAFPKNAKGKSMLEAAPIEISDEALKEYGLKRR